jgi:hypothetical protein
MNTTRGRINSPQQYQRSKALVEAARRDPANLDVPRTLLENGADVNFNKAEALRVAIKVGAVELLELLAVYPMSRESANTAFKAARKAVLSWDDRAAVYRCFSNKPISQDNLNGALQQAVTAAAADTPADVVENLLENGADPNCLNCSLVFTAWRKDNPEMTRELVMHGLDMDKFVPELFRQNMDANRICWWLRFCWGQNCSKENISDSRVLLSAIEQFPYTSDVVAILLEHGCDAGYRFRHQLQHGTSNENVTVLQWALERGHSSGNIISDEVILALLTDGQQGKYIVLSIIWRY